MEYEPGLLQHLSAVYSEWHQHLERHLEAVVEEEEGRQTPAWGEAEGAAAEAWYGVYWN